MSVKGPKCSLGGLAVNASLPPRELGNATQRGASDGGPKGPAKHRLGGLDHDSGSLPGAGCA
eukprot:3155307-Alexandrium_andersonii.AAC.1